MSPIGKLQHCRQSWEKFTNDQWILQTISGYCIEFIANPFQNKIPKEISFSEEEKKYVDFEIKDLLSKGAVVRSEWEDDQFVSNIFVVPKPNGRYRPIINLKYLNHFVLYEHFKQETFKVVLELIQEKDFFTSIDLQEAYFSVSINPFYRRFLKFIWDGELYHFVCLPFGLSTAPRLFTKILKPIYAWFRQQGIRCSYYIDDSINMNKDRNVCAENTKTIAKTLQSLGFTINNKKSVFEPSQRIIFFGFLIDSVLFCVFLTDEKITKIFNLAKFLLEKEVIVVRQLASFIGLIINAFFAILDAPLHYRCLERDKLKGLGDSECPDAFDNTMILSTDSKYELQWWMDNVSQKNGKRIRPKKVDLICRTDASFLGWGAFEVHSYRHANGRWNMEELEYSINYLELLAIFYALQSFYAHSANTHLQFQSDNVSAVAYINNMGGMNSVDMDKLAGNIWKWCLDRNIFISASHLSGVENFCADFLSRSFSDSTEWQLKREIFDRVCKQFFIPDIDLFSSRLNKQLDKFVSWFPEPGAFKTDAFSFSWQSFSPYIFAPFNLVGRVINKMVADQVDRAIFIIPLWKSQSWFPLLMSHMVSFPVRLPRHRDLLTLPHNGQTHPLARRLTMVAVMLSGRDCRVKEFQDLQLNSLSIHGGKEHKNSMVWPGTGGIFGVFQNKQIPLMRLKQL
ncbi:MAG: reverse transcriptase domain-containing protein [Candidatus Thiodiazotropha endolucinida]|nr:hypothetical protein [Candidatus Thiodiazotropha taylori]MCW4260207.1 reverse transcriptase domain-containing protein [Candidatus Thiodiazotropha endolucinida]